ncbi:hypothetical protein MACK_002631 [Theileria orientalis]|uniref:Uncharacterized protein n=1 Tax=Theileria orientalis TaxID=68886 RepID=A0A976MDR6_THEOR|nr:hypothetical protein MACK_002631 [Theileria orientalis]
MLDGSLQSNRIFNIGYVTNFHKFVCDQFDQFMKEVVINSRLSPKNKISMLDEKLVLVDEYRSRYSGTIRFLSKRIEDFKTQLDPCNDYSPDLVNALSDTEAKRLSYLIRIYTYRIKVIDACITILNNVRAKLTVIRRVLCLGKQDHKST